VNEYDYPTYVHKVSDGWGRGRIVSFAVLCDEVEDTLEVMFEMFLEIQKEKYVVFLKICFQDNDMAALRAMKKVLKKLGFTCHFHVKQVIMYSLLIIINLVERDGNISDFLIIVCFFVMAFCWILDYLDY
jgi:hypothetical protein